MQGDLRFVIDGASTFVEYPIRGHVPRVGESVCADGSDPEFPRGVYEATNVASHVTLRGAVHLVVVDVRTVYRLPDCTCRSYNQRTGRHDSACPAATPEGGDTRG